MTAIETIGIEVCMLITLAAIIAALSIWLWSGLRGMLEGE